MAVNRRQFAPSVRRFFERFEGWTPAATGLSNPLLESIPEAELRAKAAAYPEILTAAEGRLTVPLDQGLEWDKLVFMAYSRMHEACLYHRFTGDARALGWADEALTAYERCPRPHYTYSSCLGVLDIDLRTAEAALVMSMMHDCFAGQLDTRTVQRLADQVIGRCLGPGLEAMRTKQYAWMHSTANWRVILCGMFALAGMTFADRFPEWRELVEFGLEGTLVGLGTGDRAGGWNEGPGYWEYGLSYAVRFAWHLRHVTRGRVDLFRHPFLRRTGDFRLYMHTHGNQVWNWSDGEKQAGRSLVLAILARVHRNRAWQHLLLSEGIGSLGQLYYLDPALPGEIGASVPLTRHFPGPGVAVARTGFTDADTVVGIKAADIPDFNHHCHLDGGSVVIHAAGRELLAENIHWQYPREGSKDPAAKPPSRPGLWDEELKRWKRWDLDSVGALGHNVVIVEGEYPRPVLRRPPRLRVAASTPGHDVFTVDSTAYYRPLATRVKRTVVFLRPDVVLLIDELRAVRPVRARLLFHYLEEATVDGSDFRIVNGPALLRGRVLCPSRDDNLITGLDDRRTVYEPPPGLVERRNRYVYAENLWRRRRLTFVTALQAGAASLEQATFAIEGQPLQEPVWTVTVYSSKARHRVTMTPRGVLVESP